MSLAWPKRTMMPRGYFDRSLHPCLAPGCRAFGAAEEFADIKHIGEFS